MFLIFSLYFFFTNKQEGSDCFGSLWSNGCLAGGAAVVYRLLDAVALRATRRVCLVLDEEEETIMCIGTIHCA